MVTVTIFRKAICDECDGIIHMLEELQPTHPHQLAVVNVEDLELSESTATRVNYPYVKIGPYVLHLPLSRADLQIALGASIDRARHLTAVGDKTYERRITRGREFTKTDRLSLWLSKNLIHMVNVFLLLYAGLPFLAPVFMKANLAFPAKVIYTIYSPLCHQLGFRSWFLFGEQFFYPRDLAGIPGVKTFEEATGIKSTDVLAARSYVGNETVGYKVALCERDTAIYGSMFIFGILFVLTGKRMRSLPWYIWIAVGLVPIGLDGFSQLPGLAGGLPGWVPMRESTPILRVITGVLFGISTAAYLFPLLEESMRETRTFLNSKLVITGQISHTDENAL